MVGSELVGNVALALIALTVALLVGAVIAARAWRVEEESRSVFKEEELKKDSLRARLFDFLRAEIEGSGVTFSERELLSIWVACAALPPLLAVTIGLPPTIVLLAFLIGALAPALWLSALKKRARRRFSDDLGHALPLVATNLRGGLSVRQALAPVAENLDEPIRSEFSLLARNLERGMSVEDALAIMAERNDNRDLVLLSSAVATQAETGGNLADIVDTVAATIRVRTELRRTILSKTSQQRGTALFLLMFPVFILVVVCIISPTYLEFYTTIEGLLVLLVCAILELIGYVIVRRMTDMKID